jgi:hypothetical protein
MKIRNAIVILALSQVSGQAFAQSDAPPVKMTYSNTPTGKGNPNTIACRAPQKLAGSRMFGPEICKTNAVWAQYTKDGMDVAADGLRDVPSEKQRSLNPRACRSISSAGGGASNGMITNFSMLCD